MADGDQSLAATISGFTPPETARAKPLVESRVSDESLVGASMALLESLKDVGPECARPPSSVIIEGNFATDVLTRMIDSEEEDPETQWRKLADFLNDAGSRVLGHWLALFELHYIWSRRDSAIQSGYLPKRRGRKKSPKMGLFFVALKNDCNIPRTTAYRDLGYARTLVEKFGREYVFGLLGTRIANDDRFLRDLVRLDNADQGRQAVEVYTQGPGEQKAKETIELYLAVQADRAEVENPTEEDELPDETVIPWVVDVGKRVGVDLPRRGDLDIGIEAVEGVSVTGYLAIPNPPKKEPDPFRRVLPNVAPLTFESSRDVVGQVVGELRRDYLRRTTVSSVTTGRAVECRRCGGSWFWTAYSKETGNVWRCRGCHSYDELTERPNRDPRARIRRLKGLSSNVRKHTIDDWEAFLSLDWDRRPRFRISDSAENLRSPRYFQRISVDGQVAIRLCWRNKHDEQPDYPASAIDLTITPVAHARHPETVEIGRPWYSHWTTEAVAVVLRRMLRRIFERNAEVGIGVPP